MPGTDTDTNKVTYEHERKEVLKKCCRLMDKCLKHNNNDIKDKKEVLKQCCLWMDECLKHLDKTD